MRVKEAVGEYLAACAVAEAGVERALQSLSAKLCERLELLVCVAHWSLISTTVRNHVVKALSNRWSLLEVRNPDELGDVGNPARVAGLSSAGFEELASSFSSQTLSLEKAWPFWLRKEEAVSNSLSSVCAGAQTHVLFVCSELYLMCWPLNVYI